MRKWLMFAFFIVLFIVLATPLVIGLVFKRNYFQLVDIINKNITMKVDILSYQTGWLTSSANIRITLLLPDDKKNMTSSENMVMTQQISHGPLIYDQLKHKVVVAFAKMQSTIYPSDGLANLLLDNNKNKGIINITSLIHCNGHWINQINIPTLHYQLSPNKTFNWQGLNGKLTFDTDYHTVKKIMTDLTIGELTASDTESHILTYLLNIKTSHYQNNMRQQPMGIWSGNSYFTSSKLTLNTILMLIFKINFDMDGLKIETLFDSTNDLYNIKMQILFNQLRFYNEKIPDIISAKIVTAINHLNMQGIKKLNQTMKMPPQKDQEKQYNDALLNLITPNSTVNYTVSFNTAYGPALLDAQYFLPSGMMMPNTLSDFSNKINSAVHLKIAAALVDHFIDIWDKADYSVNKAVSAPTPPVAAPAKTLPINQSIQPTPSTSLPNNAVNKPINPPILSYKQWLNNWVQQGYIILKNNEYLITITSENNIIKLNGHLYQPSNPVTLPR